MALVAGKRKTRIGITEIPLCKNLRFSSNFTSSLWNNTDFDEIQVFCYLLTIKSDLLIKSKGKRFQIDYI